MVPMSSTKTFDDEQRATLLQLARASIAQGLSGRGPLAVDVADYPGPLRQARASFVTLHLDGQLRGCIGSLEAYRPLLEDIAENAWAAAFRDPRFPPLTQAEQPRLALDISVLSPARPMDFDSEQDLIAQLRPGIDGLILERGAQRGSCGFVVHHRICQVIPAKSSRSRASRDSSR